MALGKQVTVTTTPASLLTGLGVTNILQYVAHGGGNVVLRNNDATNDILIAGSSAAASTGYRLKPGAVITLGEVEGLSNMWVVSSAGSPVLDVLIH